MRLVVLGTAGYHPNNRRDTSCYFLPDEGIVLDAGTGMHRVRSLLATQTLDVLLSHAHLDHVIGLTYLPDVVWQKGVTRVTVHGAAEKLAAIERHLFAKELFPLSPSYEQQAIGPEEFLLGTCRITGFPLQHPGGCWGYRLDWSDRSLAYVTDTTASLDAAYVGKLRGVDLLIHECNFRDEQAEWARQTGHSCTSEVARVAAAAGVGRLLLTHFNPLDLAPDPISLDTARAIFPHTDLAEDNMTVEF